MALPCNQIVNKSNELTMRFHPFYVLKAVDMDEIIELIIAIKDCDPGLDSITIKARYESNINTNPYTDAEKAKLAGLETSKFKGTFTSVAALNTANPTAAPGSYAYTDSGVGQDIQEWLWDENDSRWVQQVSGGNVLLPSEIKVKYESNPDTNAFTDAEKTKLIGIEQAATADQNKVDIEQLNITVDGGSF